MRKMENRLFIGCLLLLLFLTVFLLLFVMYFIGREALPTFRELSLFSFLFGERWMPVDIGGEKAFGIFNFIAATAAVSFLALIFAAFLSIGAALCLSCFLREELRGFLCSVIDILAGISSVIYGFIGIELVTPLFIRAGVHTGSCVLAASLVLSVMLLPFMIASLSESFRKLKERYYPGAEAMGISLSYTVRSLILPQAAGSILIALILALGRAMGETMAVMMLVGNANLFPRILGKAETIASLIALEMGSAEAGSTHYHALFAAGFVLLLFLFLINFTIGLIRSRLPDIGEERYL